LTRNPKSNYLVGLGGFDINDETKRNEDGDFIVDPWKATTFST
jgi:hypothetical protein